MSLPVSAPLAGTVTTLAEVPDEVFAAQMVGPGVSVAPDGGGAVLVLAPVGGTIVKLHPHAFVITVPDGPSVLVHVGIDTVELKGRHFTLHATQGQVVAAGEPVVTVDVDAVQDAGYSAACPVVVLGAAPDTVDSDVVGRRVEAGDRLYELP
ncbi:PTS glucose transporter subunit IIA [Tersicoccus solisilvae]|uniref:PTS glucose transporter subunit IIA n=1 Tax=Tersicoccus solisilvae TaxID=1882339 RepID=A0ABQ1NWT3_9MICC|nr:PTS glucose transporter subunit IIA [Tersicoccus solisilvae]GGC86721.1 PTS glucose transporter subunit IIA [Tersicoccus solisilvae]